MKSFLNLNNKVITFFLILFVGIASLLHSTNIHFPSLNSDEASFAYNAYSILKTGKDEYGVSMPLRFKAFGENKLPVTIYSIVPSIAILGLNDIAARIPFILLGILAPVLYYFLVKEFTKNTSIALIAAFLSSFSPWIQILSRHIHEAIIIMHLGALALLILYRLMNTFSYKNVLLLSIINGIGLFTYHIAKIYAVFYFLWLLWILLYKHKKDLRIISKSVLIFLIPIFIFLATEYMNPTTRVSNLLFTSDKGFSLSINELRSENPNRLLHNKLTYATKVLTNNYIGYFSPEFLVINGDSNKRFGYPGISPITVVEYIFIFVGIYFIFKNKEHFRYLLLSALLFAPISAALTWQDNSLSRSFFMIVPLLTIIAYGLYHTIQSQQKSLKLPIITIIVGSLLFYTISSWEFYFYHYPKKTEAIYSWQSGYKELNDYIKTNYDNIDTFYITKKLGQPYIFTLFYLKYPPHEYQKQAKLTELGEYGFGEVERFDKFEFNFVEPKPGSNAAYIGYPEDFQGSNIAGDEITKISVQGEEIFWIYTSK